MILDYIIANNSRPTSATSMTAATKSLGRRRTRLELVDLVDKPSWLSN